MVRPLAIGMIGYSAGNGHPYSFSAIINGYESAAMRTAGWSVIADYLDRQSRHDIGIEGAEVTCCWADDPEIAAGIAQSCRTRAVASPGTMLDIGLDAVIIARDDWESHFELAMPFLKAGLAVFVDKPLTLDPIQLRQFAPYLENGRLMSCSALRYARELDALRARPDLVGRLQLINGVVPHSISRYGIHMLEAIVGVVPLDLEPLAAFAAGGGTHAALRAAGGPAVTIHALGLTTTRFRLSFYGDADGVEVDITDNFSAFRRCLLEFFAQVRSGTPAIVPSETVAIMNLMMKIESMAAESCS